MKRILMMCCLLAAVTTITYAQGQSAPAPVADIAAPISKSDFSQKVKELNKLLGKNKIDEANNLFTEINKMANTQLGVARNKMRAAQNETDKKKYSAITTNQRIAFSQALQMKQADIAGNRKQIIDKLHEFAGMIE